MVLLRHCSTWISHLYRPATSQLFKYQPLLPFLTRTFPSWFLRRVGELLPSKALHQHFYISDTVQEFAASVWAHQKQAHAEGKMETLTENLHEKVNSLQVRQLIVVCIYTDTKVQPSVTTVHDLVVAELHRARSVNRGTSKTVMQYLNEV